MSAIPPTNFYPPTDPKDFTDLGFAIGTVRGARTFHSTDDHCLTGMVYRQLWLPGENVADCRARQVCKPADDPYPEIKRGHLPTCRCGFYAYYDNSNDYYKPGRDLVAGMIEGYGDVLVGARGFRCTKANIVALMIPDSLDVEAIMRNYSGVPRFADFESMVAEFPCDDGGHRDLKAIEA